MIRFINLTGQILLDDTQSQFAFFNTVTDCFVEIDGEQTWESWEEFESYIMLGTSFKGIDVVSVEQRHAVLARFKSLFPTPPPQKEADEPQSLSDISQRLLYRTHSMHQSISEFEGIMPPPYGESVMDWVESVAEMDKALGFDDGNSGEHAG